MNQEKVVSWTTPPTHGSVPVVRRNIRKEEIFHQRDDGFVSVGSRGTRKGNLLGIKGTGPRPVIVPKTPKWQGRSI